MPDSEHTMTANMVATTVGVSSMTISAQGVAPGPTVSGPPVATHARVTVTTSSAHNMTDTQNQVVIAGGTNVTHVNGLWNVATIPSTTSFTYDVPYSTGTSPTTITPNANLTERLSPPQHPLGVIAYNIQLNINENNKKKKYPI